MAVYFSSDHHFGHGNIIRYCERPFSTIEEMDAVMIERWNQTVKPEDVVYYLGDFALSLSVMDRVTPLLNGVKYLVPGNHDHCYPFPGRTQAKTDKIRKRYEAAGWIILEPETCYLLFGKKVALCHFPYSGDSCFEDRYKDARPTNYGEWLLHGHVHTSWLKKDKCINVGADQWNFAPVCEDALAGLIKNY